MNIPPESSNRADVEERGSTPDTDVGDEQEDATLPQKQFGLW